MTTHVTGPETVFLGTEMGGDEGKDIQRNPVDIDEGVPPFMDVCQRGRSIPVELRNIVKGEAIEEVSLSLLKTLRASSQLCFVTYDGEYAMRFTSSFRAKMS